MNFLSRLKLPPPPASELLELLLPPTENCLLLVCRAVDVILREMPTALSVLTLLPPPPPIILKVLLLCGCRGKLAAEIGDFDLVVDLIIFC
jgi:hypothetical protein